MRPNRFERLFPLNVLLLEGMGTVLLVLGLMKLIAGIEVLPASLRFEGYALTFVVGGIILMMPMLLHIIGIAQAVRDKRQR